MLYCAATIHFVLVCFNDSTCFLTDLSTVEVNLDNRVYRRLSDFIKDVTKIFNNCRLYNPVDTPFFQCAEVVETFFAQRMKSLKDKLLHTLQ